MGWPKTTASTYSKKMILNLYQMCTLWNMQYKIWMMDMGTQSQSIITRDDVNISIPWPAK